MSNYLDKKLDFHSGRVINPPEQALQGEVCMINIIAVFLGGGTGALLRWLACSKIPAHWGTLTVNIAGAFLIGILYQYIYLHSGFKQELKLLLMTGVLGGFTTFSTYLLDFVTLINKGHLYEAGFYLTTSVITGVIFLIIGIKLMNWIN